MRLLRKAWKAFFAASFQSVFYLNEEALSLRLLKRAVKLASQPAVQRQLSVRAAGAANRVQR